MPFVNVSLSRTVLLFASVHVALVASTPAQGLLNQPADESLRVTVTSASGAARHPLHHRGLVDRVGLAPGQTVSVNLVFPGKTTGTAVTASALDGGVLSGHENLATSAEGVVQFSYQAGSLPGCYRVAAEIAGQEYILEFYVVDLNNPGNNPTPVRVVD